MIKKPTSLVTGGAGFIGSYVVDELIKKGHKVVILDDLSGGNIGNLSPLKNKYKFVKGSICDAELVNRLFKKYKFDYVYHLAAYAAEGLSHHIRSFNYQNNLIGSTNLITAAVNSGRCRCFVFTSSIAVYGHVEEKDLPVNESAPCVPADPYGIAKLAVEQDLKAANEYYNLPYVIFRPHNVYGERQNIWDKYRNVVGIFMRQLAEGKPFTIFGDGNQKRAFTYIADIVPVIAGCVHNLNAYNQIFNIGSENNVSVNHIAKIIGGTIYKKKYLPARNEVVNIYASNVKIIETFNNVKTTALFDGLQQMFEWAKKQPKRRQVKFKNIEIKKNLPKSWNPSKTRKKEFSKKQSL